eukprot:TRINITY_DN387_c0_g1_i1.p1 TRINITY_DN387_c0_g1~~TRINITY_DN387_c0_g1_i1.p1  ORF type:complete len:163 (+),score=34.44 TRINITY_DN387_c0_g1_i1:249-737(+)
MMKALIFAVICFVFVIAQNYNPCSNQVQQNWCDCAAPGSDITVTSVTLNPNPVVKGSNVSVTATSVDSAKYAIVNGTINLVVKYGFITLLSKQYNLCTELALANQKDPSIQPCPVQPYATRTVSFSHLVPDVFPSGTYKGYANVTDQNGNTVQCIQYDMHIA